MPSPEQRTLALALFAELCRCHRDNTPGREYWRAKARLELREYNTTPDGFIYWCGIPEEPAELFVTQLTLLGYRA